MAKQNLYTVTDSANPDKPYLSKVPLDTVAVNMNITEEEAQIAVNTGKLLYNQYRIVPASSGGSSGGLLILLGIVIVAIIGAIIVLVMRRDKPGEVVELTPTPTIEVENPDNEDPFGEDFLNPPEDEPTPTPEEPEPTEEPEEPEPTEAPEEPEEPEEPVYDWEPVTEEEMQETLNDKQYSCSFSVLDAVNFKTRNEAASLEFSNMSRDLVCDFYVYPLIDGNVDYEHELAKHTDIEYQKTVQYLTFHENMRDFLPVGESEVIMKVMCKEARSGEDVGFFYVSLIVNIMAD